MAKVNDFDLHKIGSQLEAFKDEVRLLLNNGKAQFQVNTTIPTYAGHAGEITFYRSGTDGRLYLYMGSSWNVVALFTADASPLA